MADEVKTDPAVKPGYKTTEFWLTKAAMVVGLLLAVIPSTSPAMKYVGIAAAVLSLLGYQVTRAIVKNAAVLLLVLLPLFMTGCNKGMIKADAVGPLTTDVCDRHDKLVTGQLDPKTLSEADKATYLRSSQLLRKVLSEAQK